MLCTATLGRTPLLLLLLPFALGIYLSTEHHCPGLPILGSGALLLALSLLCPSSPLAWRQRGRNLLVVAIALITLALGILRTDIAPQPQRPTEGQSLRLYLVASLESSCVLPQAQRLMNALTLGYLPQDDSSRAMREQFARSSAAHLLAVSGYHLALVVGCLGLLLRRLKGFAPQYYYLCLTAGAWAFTALSGWAVPTIRAALMLSLYALGRGLGKRPYVPNILAGAALIQLVYQPYELYAWSMYLSYAAVLSIHLYYTPITRLLSGLRNPLLRHLWQAIALTLAAQVLTLPLVLHLFGYVSFAFVLTALPLLFLANLIIPLSLVAYTLAAMGWSLGIVANTLNALSSLMLSLTKWASGLDILLVSLPFSRWALLLCWLLSFALAYYLYQRNARKGSSTKL